MPKKITIFGSTGSIGQSTINVIRQNPNQYQVQTLVAGSNYQLLAKQAKELKPQNIAIKEQKHYQALKDLLKDQNIDIHTSQEAIDQLATQKCDIFVAAITGIQALRAIFNAINAGSNIGLANKECLVACGSLIKQAAKKSGSKLLPIDSEHNAIFQIFEKDNFANINDVILTASGGPFLKTPLDQFDQLTPDMAIKHPNWPMGKKISVDSATMANKSLEVIEAHHLFDLSSDKIKILIHPQSIIHGIVNYSDGSSLSMMGVPNMQIPISYVLNYPKRATLKDVDLNLAKIGQLDFIELDHKRFPIVKLAYDTLKQGQNAPCIFNAANEMAVNLFLNNQIKFPQIAQIIDEVLQKTSIFNLSSIDDVINCQTHVNELKI